MKTLVSAGKTAMDDFFHIGKAFPHNAFQPTQVSWQPGNKCFRVHDPNQFVSTVMPRFFKQTKYKSFQRQLVSFSRLGILHLLSISLLTLQGTFVRTCMGLQELMKGLIKGVTCINSFRKIEGIFSVA